MANSYENTIMPEKPEVQIKPDAIPVDDKGQPLPDPTESLGSYIAPKGVEELKKAYSEVEVDETVRETMEPPQRTGLLRKHRSGTKRGYDYYGTPAGSIPNDSNGLKPSPLAELFSEAEALEPDFDLEKIKNHVLNDTPEPGSEYKVVETPKLDPSLIKQGNAFEPGDKILSDNTLKRTEVVKDPNAPKFLDMYKESTNTKVIYQSGVENSGEAQKNKPENDAKEIFAEHSRVTKTKKRLSKREEKKAIKAAIKLEKKKAKERRKAEKAARKAAKKGKGAPQNAPQITEPDEIMKMKAEAARREKEEKTAQEKAAAKKVEEEKRQAEKEADIQKIKTAQGEKEEAKKQLELANRQKEEAQQEAQRAAQEAEKRIQEEKEAAELQKEQVMRQLDEEKEAVRKAEEEAKTAREEAEQLKAELEKMKAEAAQALAQKQAAEDAAKLAREEKENLDKEIKKMSQGKQRSSESTKKGTEEKTKTVKEKPAAKAKTEKESAAQKNKNASKNEKKDGYTDSPTMEVIKRRLAEMEAQLSSKDADE